MPRGLAAQALLVIRLKQAPAAGVVVNDLQDGMPLFIHQRLIDQCAREQLHGLAKLDAARLQALLVERVALHQMLAQHARGPNAELCGARR